MMMMMMGCVCIVKEMDVYTTALFCFMIQCLNQVTQFLFAINRQEGEKREREIYFSLVKEKEGNLLVD